MASYRCPGCRGNKSRSLVWQCRNNKVGYLPIFYNSCDLKWVSLLGVKPPTFPVDRLQSRENQWHHPMGWSAAGRPYLIHAKAVNKSTSKKKVSMAKCFYIFPFSTKTGDCEAKTCQKKGNVQRNRGKTPIVELLPAGTKPVAHIPNKYLACPLVENGRWRHWPTANISQCIVVCKRCELFTPLAGG